MEDEAQKMLALKKAYAEIILNTSKEAAARVMASERKALRFQQDLCCVKDEALRMLLRMRQMIDLKTTEAEMTSFRQRSRIEELEAQLHEAEDIIEDLRSELKLTKVELQKMMNKKEQPWNGQLPKVEALSLEKETHNDRLNAPEPVTPSPLDSGLEIVPKSDTRNTPMHQRVLDSEGCNARRRTESSSDSHLDNYYADTPDLTSIIMRSKELEPYRNGCTQRIRALERNSVDGKLPPGDMDDQYFILKNESVIETNRKGGGLHTVPSPKAQSIDRMKNLAELEEGKQLSSSTYGDQPVKVIWRFRRRRTRYGTGKTTSHKTRPHQLMKSSEPSSALSHCKPSPDSGNDIVKSGEGTCTVSSPSGNDINYMKNCTELEEKVPHNDICYKDQAVKSGRRRYRKRDVKHRGTFVTPCTSPLDQLTEPSQPSCFLSCCNTCSSYPVNNNTHSGEEQSKITENEAKMKPPTRLNPGLTLIKTDVDPVSGSVNVTLSVKDANKFEPIQNAADEDTELAGVHIPVKEEGDAAGSSRLPSCKLDLEMVDAPYMDSDLIDIKASEVSNGATSMADNNRLLKYTFQRKRKKESSNDLNENSSPEKSTIKRRAMKKQNGAKAQKSNSINESSRDSRRLAQVARQLISLSGKRW